MPEEPQPACNSVQRRCQPAPRVARERIVDAELVENADHDAADVVLGAVGRRESLQQHVQRPRLIAGVKRRECVLDRCQRRVLALQRDPRGQALRGEAAGYPPQNP